ncbi:MAG: LysE family transporter [Cyanobacteria bacterium SBLK]|nr:LysE family transporter [Cyanobacteria bacterium SBLK]
MSQRYLSLFCLDLAVLSDIAATYPANQRIFFTSGMVSASLVWYFGLAYGAYLLTPLFQRPLAWQILDTIIGVIMWGIAGSLIISLLNGFL